MAPVLRTLSLDGSVLTTAGATFVATDSLTVNGTVASAGTIALAADRVSVAASAHLMAGVDVAAGTLASGSSAALNISAVNLLFAGKGDAAGDFAAVADQTAVLSGSVQAANARIVASDLTLSGTLSVDGSARFETAKLTQPGNVIATDIVYDVTDRRQRQRFTLPRLCCSRGIMLSTGSVLRPNENFATEPA